MAKTTAAGATPIAALLKEKRRFAPPKEFVKRANMNRASIYKEAARNPTRFWERFARELDCPTPLFAATTAVYNAAMAFGFAEADTASVCAVLESWAKTGRRVPSSPRSRRRG